MRKLIFLTLVLFSVQVSAQNHKVNWMTWEQAIEANKTHKKKIFIDLYTDWCGWCKVMDRNVFSDSAVAAYMNEHFYCVKFNAESKNDIKYQNVVFKYKAENRHTNWPLACSMAKCRIPAWFFSMKKSSV
jgi:uncharacterized protein YyaL (SSP411 family)